jgi:hypothetical protein
MIFLSLPADQETGLKNRLFLAEDRLTLFRSPMNEPGDTTMKRRACWMICLITLLCGCSQQDSPPKQTLVGGGRAEMDFHGMKLIAEGKGPGPAVTNEGGDKVFLTVAGKRIEVQKEQILVDGVTKAKISSGTKSIRAVSRNDEVVVEVDGKEVFKVGP